MVRPRGRRAKFGRKSANSGKAIREAPRPKTSVIKTTSGTLDGEIGECPECGEMLKVRKDGKISNHRRGTSRKQSWPCLGGGQPPKE